MQFLQWGRGLLWEIFRGEVRVGFLVDARGGGRVEDWSWKTELFTGLLAVTVDRQVNTTARHILGNFRKKTCILLLVSQTLTKWMNETDR